jgi:Tol biopolymer transport system component
MRAVVVNIDGTNRRPIARELAEQPDSWTQFAGWSPDGKTAIIVRGWESPTNAQWEEEHKQFRFTKGDWLVDSYLVDLASGKATDLTEVERVSHYNTGVFFIPNTQSLGFTPLIDGNSKPFVMDRDGRNKRDVSGKGGGFAYGYSASPDGKRISFHENYQIYVANSDGSDKQHIATGNPFNFGPQWSPNGQWLLFLSGVHHHSNPYIVRADGTGLRRLADLGGFLDVADFHEGSSDLPVWSTDGASVFYTARVGLNVELFQTTLDGALTRLSNTPAGTIHYHPQPSRDGKWLAYGSKREGIRQLFVMPLSDRSEIQITDLKRGEAAIWAHWQPSAIER